MKPQTVVIALAVGVPAAWALWQALRQRATLRGKEADLRRREEELVDLSARLSAASTKAVEELERRKRELAELISLCDERLAELRRQSSERRPARPGQLPAAPRPVAVPAPHPVNVPAPPPAATAEETAAAATLEPDVSARRGPGGDVLARYRQIYDLADRGVDLAEVARLTKAGRSEVELVLALRAADLEVAAGLTPARAPAPAANGAVRRPSRRGGDRS